MFARKPRPNHAEPADVEFEPVGTCPRCGLPVMERGSIFSCASNVWDAEQKRPVGCGFVIHKLFAHRTLTAECVRQLLEEGKTDVMGPFRSHGGKHFNAALYLTESGNVDITDVKTLDE